MFYDHRYPKYGKEWFIYNEDILSYFDQIEDYKSLEESANKFVLDNSEGVYRFPKTKLDNKKVPEIDIDYILNNLVINKVTRSNGKFIFRYILPHDLSNYSDDDLEEINKFVTDLNKFKNSSKDKFTSYSCTKYLTYYEFSSDRIKEACINLIPSNRMKFALLNSSKERIIANGYNVTKIYREAKSSVDNKVFLEKLRSIFEDGKRYTNSFIKENLEQTFHSLGGNPDKRFNPSELGNWFNIKTTKITVDGKREYGYLILGMK